MPCSINMIASVSTQLISNEFSAIFKQSCNWKLVMQDIAKEVFCHITSFKTITEIFPSFLIPGNWSLVAKCLYVWDIILTGHKSICILDHKIFNCSSNSVICFFDHKYSKYTNCKTFKTKKKIMFLQLF